MRQLAVRAALCAATVVGSASTLAGQAGAPSRGGVGKTPARVPAVLTVGPLALMSESALSLRDSIVALARAQVGRKYVFGGESPERGFDCSGLVRYVMSFVDLKLPRTAKDQSRVGVAIPRDTTHLRPGDLLTFGRGGVSHIGIYVGGGRFIHASTVAKRVIETTLDRPKSPKIKPWAGVRRLVAHDSTLAAVGG